MHFTPTSASWLNMVERFFRDITVNRLRRGVFISVPELVAAIDEYIAHHNTKPKPFIWTKSAADILQKVIRANSRLSSKQNATLHYASPRQSRSRLPAAMAAAGLDYAQSHQRGRNDRLSGSTAFHRCICRPTDGNRRPIA
jgi:hypothetical protein